MARRADWVVRLALASVLIMAACTPRAPAPVVQPPAREPEPEPVEEAPPAAFVLGVILPLSGDETLTQYAELVREGIEMAVAGADTLLDRDFEMIVLDDEGIPSRAAERLRELAESGADAVIGPLLGDGMAAAAAARSDPDLIMISPTAPESPIGPNLFTLSAEDLRGAQRLAQYAAANGLSPVALLYPAERQWRAQAAAFRAAAQAAGLAIGADIEYMAGTTTFGDQLGQILESGARAVYIPASTRDVRQIAPQLGYYGLGDVQVLGSEAWVAPEVLASLPPATIEGVVAAMPLFEASPAVAWSEFVTQYEASQRRTLDNPYPALGYDAARLLLAAAAQGPDRADVVRGLMRIEAYRGATGVLSVSDGSVVREPFLVRIVAGQPVLVSDAQ